MRLDEWQKYLDAQFVDEEQEAKVKPVTPGKTSTEKPTDTRKLRQPSLALDESMWVVDTPPATSPGANGEQSVVEGSTTAPTSHALEASALSASPIVRRETPRPTVAGEAPRPHPFGEPPTIKADIPSFESYLPATHAAMQTEISLPPGKATSGEQTASLPASNDSSELPTGAFSVLMPMTTSGLLRPHTSATVERHSVESENASRRAPRSRARHARNVRPEYVPSGLSAAELWATVPKHVQTLLALGRMEDIEEEVAQSSYKRPFQETRQELIERLLDPILSLEDAARLLNVCPTTVRRYTNKGILTHYRKEPDRPSTGGNTEKETRQRRFRLSDILAFLEAQQAAIEADRQTESRHANIKEAG